VAKILDLVSMYSSFLPVGVGLLLFSSSISSVKKTIVFFIITAAFDAIVFSMAHEGKNNIPIINIFELTETIFILYLFSLYTNKQNFRRAAFAAGIVYILCWIAIYLSIYSLYSFTPNEKIARGALLMIFVIWLLIVTSNGLQIPLAKNYSFWIGLGFLLYFSSTLIIMGTSQMVFTGEKNILLHYSWTLHSTITIITNFIFSYGLVCSYQNRKSFLS
jgi:hypothetical protein